MTQWNDQSGGNDFPPMMFDASKYSPDWGGGAAFLPIENQPEVGWLVAIKSDNGMKQSKSGAGYYREIILVGMEGPISGDEFAWRWNLLNDNQTTVDIAHAQISALCNVLGVGRFNQPMELAGKPFRLVAEKQKGENPQGYTQLARNGIRDVNGNLPGKGTGAAAAQNPPQPGQQPPAGPPPAQPGQPPQPTPPMGPQGQWTPQQPPQAQPPAWTPQGAPAAAPAAPDWQQGNSGAPGWSR